MAAGTALARVELTTPQGTTPAASLLVRANHAVAKVGATVVAERDGVVSVTRRRRLTTVTFDDGEVWTALRKGGCSACGG